ncbi:hypothetical protein PM082_007202 [Marasmius tenuissimus]|nr:hypothetical protein PM082_007202 [Marasmius tenuissimus]
MSKASKGHLRSLTGFFVVQAKQDNFEEAYHLRLAKDIRGPWLQSMAKAPTQDGAMSLDETTGSYAAAMKMLKILDNIQ